jgi:hypothetical protein
MDALERLLRMDTRMPRAQDALERPTHDNFHRPVRAHFGDQLLRMT